MPEPVSRTEFVSCFVVLAHALIRIIVLLLGAQYTRAGRKVYR